MTTTNKYFSRLVSLLTVLTRKTAYNTRLAAMGVEVVHWHFVLLGYIRTA